VIGQTNYQDDNSTGGQQFTYVQTRAVIQSPTAGSEDAEYFISVEDGSGSLVDYIKVNEAGDGFVSLGASIELIDFDIVLGTTTGTKIGTATTQKIGFWNATPVVQPAHIADPTADVTSLKTAVDAILAQMATTGMQAAS